MSRQLFFGCRRGTLVVLAAGTVVGSLILPGTAQGRGTQATWSIERSDNFPVPVGTLSAVSCTGAASCVAVGSTYDTSAVESPLAESWNGTSWAAIRPPVASATAVAALSGVSCPATGDCIAVGVDQVPSHVAGAPLVETWNGTAWTDKLLPTPLVYGQLAAVSCSAADACVAVGTTSNANTGYTIAETFDGTTWSVAATPQPSGAHQAQLDGVSCTSASACVAVGQYEPNDNTTLPFADVWDGSTWTLETPALPSGVTAGWLDGVSCLSATSCTAAGAYPVGEGNDKPLAELWNGSTWGLETVPLPAGSINAHLGAVSCVSATSCTASGTFGDGGGKTYALAETWSGTAWSAATLPYEGPESSLDGASCAAGTCVLVGTTVRASTQVLAFAATGGGAFADVHARSPLGVPDSRDLTGVSCAAGADCEAVGEAFTGPDQGVAAAEVWNGSAWDAQPVTTPKGLASSELAAVSCVSATFCQAVGSWAKGRQSGVLFAGWNGTTWTADAVTAASMKFTGMSCISASFCMAAGFAVIKTNVPEVEIWNGSSWGASAATQPSGATYAAFAAVSCTSSTSCVAVGGATNASSQNVPLAEGWDGTSWTVETTPVPSGSTSTALDGVSCRSASACEAVGQATHLTLAEVWNGSTWSLQTTPTPTEGANQYTELQSVSCTSTTACTAVGSYSFTGVFKPSGVVVETWDGSGWTLDTAPDVPTARTSSVLDSVSCQAGATCTAVGFSTHYDRPSLTLAERG